METENRLRLSDILQGLHEGRSISVPLHQYKELEIIKEAAFLYMGPLCVTVNIHKETYRVQRDRTKEFLKNPSRWY